MTAAKWRALAERLLNGNGASTITWTRRTITSNGPAGTAVATDPELFDVRVAQLDAQSSKLVDAQSWQAANVRLIMSAAGLPFTPETHSGFPEVHYEDVVSWLGVDMRVVHFQAWAAPGGPAAPPEPLAYFVGLGA